MTSPTVTTALHYLMFEKHQNIYSQGDEEGDKGVGGGGWARVEGIANQRIIYSLAQGAKNWEPSVKSELQAFNGPSFIIFSFIYT